MGHARRTVIFLVAAIAVLLIWKLNILGVVFLFLLAGVVPGTSLSVPPFLMLTLLGVMGIAVFNWTKRQQLIKEIRSQTQKHKQPSRSEQPHGPLRRRFTGVT
ncbi:MAG TPA: hypothetical protein VNX65_00070 [Patescibacteria group bacterium]|nr:hypothetical protein [Patescibacteria group bacterium]